MIAFFFLVLSLHDHEDAFVLVIKSITSSDLTQNNSFNFRVFKKMWPHDASTFQTFIYTTTVQSVRVFAVPSRWMILLHFFFLKASARSFCKNFHTVKTLIDQIPWTVELTIYYAMSEMFWDKISSYRFCAAKYNSNLFLLIPGQSQTVAFN